MIKTTEQKNIKHSSFVLCYRPNEQDTVLIEFIHDVFQAYLRMIASTNIIF